MRILITGATGFIGRNLVEKCLSLGWNVIITVRPGSDISWVNMDKVKILSVNFSNYEDLYKAFWELTDSGNHPPFDYVAHLLGATKCRWAKDFYYINYEYTYNIIKALDRDGMRPYRFLFMSSLAAVGRPIDYTMPLTVDQEQRPDTYYGKSKLLAERELYKSKLNYTILEPTGVYGPYEKEYNKIIRLARIGLLFTPYRINEYMTLIYVKDLVRLCLKAFQDESMVFNRYVVSDGKAYSSNDFKEAVKKVWGVRHIVVIRIFRPLLYILCLLGSFLNLFVKNLFPLNLDKYNMIQQAFWRCDNMPLHKVGFYCDYDLVRGLTDMKSDQ